MSKKKKSITLLLRNYFITGVVVLIPIGFTLYLSKVLIGLSSRILPENINPNSYLPFEIPGIEILISLIFITIVGGLSLSFLGKRILKLIDDLFILAEKEIKRIEKNNENISKFKPLIKLYDRADIINDIA